jgi:hypothetical protein
MRGQSRLQMLSAPALNMPASGARFPEGRQSCWTRTERCPRKLINVDYQALRQEVAQWHEQAYLSELENDDAAPLWHKAADRAIEKLEAFEAGRKSVLEHLPRDCVRVWAQALIEETERAGKGEPEPDLLDEWNRFQAVAQEESRARDS